MGGHTYVLERGELTAVCQFMLHSLELSVRVQQL